MTTFTTDRADSGEIPRLIGETTHHISAADRKRILGDDPTKNLRAERDAILASNHHLRMADPTCEIPVIDVDDTVTYLPALPSLADPYAVWERVAGADETAVHTILQSLTGATAGLDGELEGPQSPPPPLPPVPPTPTKRSVPVAAMVDREPLGVWGKVFYRGTRRREPRLSPWFGLAIAIAVSAGMVAGVVWAASVVIP